MRKQPTVCDATVQLVSPRDDVWETGAEIPYWWRVTTQISGNVFNWMKQIFNQSEALTQIWVGTRHQYGISALVFQTSFRGETSGGVAKCPRFFSGSMWSFSNDDGDGNENISYKVIFSLQLQPSLSTLLEVSGVSVISVFPKLEFLCMPFLSIGWFSLGTESETEPGTFRSIGNSVLIPLTTRSLTIKWKLGCRNLKQKQKN